MQIIIILYFPILKENCYTIIWGRKILHILIMLIPVIHILYTTVLYCLQDLHRSQLQALRANGDPLVITVCRHDILQNLLNAFSDESAMERLLTFHFPN